jgi:hypothetical protein
VNVEHIVLCCVTSCVRSLMVSGLSDTYRHVLKYGVVGRARIYNIRIYVYEMKQQGILSKS